MFLLGVFLFISALLLWLLIGAGDLRSKGHWAIKLPFIILVPLVMMGFWHSINSYRGWPINGGLPTKSIVVSYIVDEPNPATHDSGHIDLWLIPANQKSDLISYHPGQGEPRAYHVQYSKQLHQQLQNLGKGPQGTPVLEVIKGHRGAGINPGQKIRKQYYHAYILPPELPPKPSRG